MNYSSKKTRPVKNSFAKIFKIVNTQSPSAGFTLIELLIAMSLTMVAVGLGGFGLVRIMTINIEAEAKTQRRTEIYRATEFISNEVRMARGVNRTPTIILNAGNTLDAVVTSSGLTPSSALGASYGTIVLYLEIPITATGACTSTYDRVIYNIIPNTASWLGPRMINRYGRTPNIDGTINPCTLPTNETFIDSISDSNISPTCASPAISAGSGGFYSCVNGRQVDIHLRSKVSNTETENANTKAFTRISP